MANNNKSGGREELLNLILRPTEATKTVQENVEPPRFEGKYEDRLIEAAVLSVICVAALVGNISLWLVVCRDRTLRTTSNCLILCLSAADLLVSAINMPVTVVTIIYGKWMLSQTACVVLGFITMITFIASVMSLGVISINRFTLICYPTQFKLMYTPVRTAFMIIGTWALSVSLASPPLYGWGEYDYLPGQSFCFCKWNSSFSYTIFMVATCFGGPCTVMSVCYVGILRTVRESRRKIRGLSSSSSHAQQDTTSTVGSSYKAHIGDNSKAKPNNEQKARVIRDQEANIKVIDNQTVHPDQVDVAPSTSAITTRNKYLQQQPTTSDVLASVPSSPSGSTKRVSRRRHQEDLRLTLTLLIVISIFVICWLPFCITMFLSVFSPHPVPRAADITTLLLGCFNSMCNPIIYGIMNKRFWDGYKRLYCCLCGRNAAMNGGSRSGSLPSDLLDTTGNQSWREVLQ